MGKTVFILAGCILLLAVTARSHADAYGSGWYGEVQATYGYEDNISRTWLSDTPDDRISSLSIGGGHSRKLGDNAQLILSGYAFYNKHDEYDALDNWAVSIGADYTLQPIVAYDASWLRVKANLTRFEYPDNMARNSAQLDLDLSVNRRLGSTVIGHLGLRGMNRNLVGMSAAEEHKYRAFDREAVELYAGVDVEVSSGVYLFAEYGIREGDIISNIPGGPSPGPDIGGAVYAIETPDEIFDAPCERRCLSGYTYQVEGHTNITTIGIAFPVQPLNINVDLTGSYFDAQGDDGRKYQDWVVRLGLIWNF